MNMRSILLLLCLLPGLEAFAQYRSVFGRDSTAWYIGYGYGEATVNWRHMIRGDTTVSGIIYHHVYNTRKGSALQYHKLIREDTISGRLYSRSPGDSAELLLMDLSLSVGDTFFMGRFAYVLSEIVYDTLLVVNVSFVNGLKVLQLHSSLSFYEGVGPNRLQGGFMPQVSDPHISCALKDTAAGFDKGSQCENYILASLAETADGPVMSAFPNPATGILSVSLYPGCRSLKLMDGTGRVVLSEPISAASVSVCLDVNTLEPGIYILEAAGSQTTQRLRICKE